MTSQNINRVSEQALKVTTRTEAVWVSITNRVFSRLWPESQVRTWLQSLVFERALGRAYVNFADTYPRWADSFFDEHFVRRTAKPLLSRYLHPSSTLPPSPIELASLWADQFRIDDPARKYRANVTPVAAHFLGCLEAELQPLF